MLVPALPGFFALYPGIRLGLGCSDRPADLLEEGVDCVVRGGAPLDSALVVQPVGEIDVLCCAAPASLAARNVPTHPRELLDHDVVRYFATRYGETDTWNFNRGGERLELLLDGHFAVNDSEAYLEAGLAGLGIIQTSTLMAEGALRDGRLVRLQPDWRPVPVPIYMMYPSGRRLSAKVRVLVAWVSSVLARAIEAARLPGTPN